MANDRKHGGRNGRSRPWGSQSSRQTGANSMSIPASKMRTFGSSASTSSEAETKEPKNVQQSATQKPLSSTAQPTKQPIKHQKQNIEHATAPAPLLELVSDFLQEYGYEESARSLRVEIRKRGPSNHSKPALSNGTVTATPSLLKVYEAAQTISAPVKDAQKTGKTAKKDGTAGAKESASSSSSSDEDSDDEASDSDSSSSDSDLGTGMSDAGSDSSASSSSSSGRSSSSSAAPAAMKNSAKTAARSLKRKASSSGSDSSSASESSSSSSDSDSAIVPEPVSKKTKKDAKETKVAKLKRSKSSSASTSHSESDSASSSSDSSASDESESDSTSSSGSSISAADISLPSSASDSSLSGSSSSSDSDSEDSDARPSSTLKQKKKKKTVENGIKLEGTATSTETEPTQLQRKSSDSSATLEAPSTPIEDGSESSLPAHTSAKRKRLVSPEEGTVVPAPEGNTKRVKKENVPFSRIPVDTKVDPKFASNAYVSYDYAERAYRDLIVTKGKGFTKEKNKKKRGAYRGGMIDMAPKGIKFED